MLLVPMALCSFLMMLYPLYHVHMFTCVYTQAYMHAHSLTPPTYTHEILKMRD